MEVTEFDSYIRGYHAYQDIWNPVVGEKTHYRRLLLQYVLAKIDNATKATDVTSSINVLIAIRWVALAWKEVKGTTIIKCFKKAGILSDTLDIQESTCICSSEDPFEDVDEAASLAPLISAAMGTQDACSVSDYVNGDSELPVCTDLDNDHWEDNFMDFFFFFFFFFL